MPYAYEQVPGLFELSTWDRDIDANFGLRLPDWRAFTERVRELEQDAAEDEFIKVVYCARHGEAEHNVLAERYGMPEGDMVQLKYPITDPLLTPAGRLQAIRLGTAFERYSVSGMPLPTRFFTSPMRRPGETCGLEWRWLFGTRDHAKTPCQGKDMSWNVPAECVEELREHLHVHHCDERLRTAELKKLFPSFEFPSSMPDEDLVWRPGSVRGRETEDEMVERAGRGLEIIMDACKDDTYISLTSHSGVLRAVYKNLHVPAHRLATGEMNVLVLRVRKSEEPIVNGVV